MPATAYGFVDASAAARRPLAPVACDSARLDPAENAWLYPRMTSSDCDNGIEKAP